MLLHAEGTEQLIIALGLDAHARPALWAVARVGFGPVIRRRLTRLHSTGASAVERALLAHLIGVVWRCIRIEGLPARRPVGLAALSYIYGRAIKDAFIAASIAIGHARGDEGAAAADSLGVYMGILFVDTCVRERTDDAACGTARCRACGSCDEPARRNNRTYTWNSQQS